MIRLKFTSGSQYTEKVYDVERVVITGNYVYGYNREITDHPTGISVTARAVGTDVTKMIWSIQTPPEDRIYAFETLVVTDCAGD